MKELDLQYPTCPIRNVLSRISDKWSLLILCSLGASGIMRHKDIKAAIPDISQKVLSSTLKRLEDDYLINRQMYKEIPPRVEYQLTETGKSLLPHIQSLVDWALVHKETIIKSREKSSLK